MADDLTKNQLRELVDGLKYDNLRLEEELEKAEQGLKLADVAAQLNESNRLSVIETMLQKNNEMLEKLLKSQGCKAPTRIGRVMTEGRNNVRGGVYADGKGGYRNAHGKAIDEKGNLLNGGDDEQRVGKAAAAV